jgi:hypothetical protein
LYLLERVTALKKRLYGEFILYTKIRLKGREKRQECGQCGYDFDGGRRREELFVPETGATHDLAAADVDAAGIISAVVLFGFAQIPAKVHITIRIIGDAHE